MSDSPAVTPYAAPLGEGVYMSAMSVMSRLLHIGRRRADQTLTDVWLGNIQNVRNEDPYYFSGDLTRQLAIDTECDDQSRLFEFQLAQLGL